VRTCEGCQFYARKTNLPAHTLQTIPAHGPSPYGGWISSGPCGKRPGATPTY
jgi:hypothetical protein